jgi:hypothetical protein
VSDVTVDFWGFVAFAGNHQDAKKATQMTALLPRAENCWDCDGKRLDHHDPVLIVNVGYFSSYAEPDLVIASPDGKQYGVWKLGKDGSTVLTFEAGENQMSGGLKVHSTITLIPELKTVLENNREGQIHQVWLDTKSNLSACVVDLDFGKLRPGPAIGEKGKPTKWDFRPKSKWSQALSDNAIWSFESSNGLTVDLVEGAKSRTLDLIGDDIEITVSNLPPHIPGGGKTGPEVIHHFAGYYDLLGPPQANPANSHVKPGDRPLPQSTRATGVNPKKCGKAILWK